MFYFYRSTTAPYAPTIVKPPTKHLATRTNKAAAAKLKSNFSSKPPPLILLEDAQSKASSFAAAESNVSDQSRTRRTSGHLTSLAQVRTLPKSERSRQSTQRRTRHWIRTSKSTISSAHISKHPSLRQATSSSKASSTLSRSRTQNAHAQKHTLSKTGTQASPIKSEVSEK